MQDNPLHIALFPPHEKEKLDMSFLLNSCLDIFDIRQNNNTLDQDLGLLQAVDERLATYGWLTNTGVKFVIVVDMAGKAYNPDDEKDKKKNSLVTGLRDSDLKPVCTCLPSSWGPVLTSIRHSVLYKRRTFNFFRTLSIPLKASGRPWEAFQRLQVRNSSTR